MITPLALACLLLAILILDDKDNKPVLLYVLAFASVVTVAA